MDIDPGLCLTIGGLRPPFLPPPSLELCDCCRRHIAVARQISFQNGSRPAYRMTRNRRDFRHRRSGATEMHNRSAPQVHVEKATLDAVLAGNLVNTCLSADLREQVSEVVGLVRPAGLLADDVDGSVLGRLVQHLRELWQDRNLDNPISAATCLLGADLHYIPS